MDVPTECPNNATDASVGVVSAAMVTGLIVLFLLAVFWSNVYAQPSMPGE